MLRGRLIGFAALAVAALTDAIPAAGAVATLVDAAASRAGAVGA